MKQQTAVEWFWNQLPEILPFTVDTETAVKLQEAYQQAKEMEKEQRIESYRSGRIDQQNNPESNYNRMAEDFYNETYGGNK